MAVMRTVALITDRVAARGAAATTASARLYLVSVHPSVVDHLVATKAKSTGVKQACGFINEVKQPRVRVNQSNKEGVLVQAHLRIGQDRLEDSRGDSVHDFAPLSTRQACSGNKEKRWGSCV